MLQPQVDTELRDAICDVIDDLDPRHRIPRSEVRHLAEEAILEHKATDGEWIFKRLQAAKKEMNRKRNIAKLRGYAPFSNLNLRVYRRLHETFGEDFLQLMQTGLRDPEDIHSKWAYRFACAVQDIGLEECKSRADDLYQFVMGHAVWERNFVKYNESFADWLGLKPKHTEDEKGPVADDAAECSPVVEQDAEDSSMDSQRPAAGEELGAEDDSVLQATSASAVEVPMEILTAADPERGATQFSSLTLS
ncbi:MAG: hypothetical protein OXT67_05085 [Zetaproteobacteria bacterium]|nr:hypothetical protein [Zetaproteobacteria bacterium]